VLVDADEIIQQNAERQGDRNIVDGPSVAH
jgi:hypothetical protein